jgi:hypothetical protein
MRDIRPPWNKLRRAPAKQPCDEAVVRFLVQFKKSNPRRNGSFRHTRTWTASMRCHRDRAAVGLASMFLPPGYQRDCACAYSLTRARPGLYWDRIKPSVCATPAPAVMRYASSPVGGEVCPASRLTIRHPPRSEGQGWRLRNGSWGPGVLPRWGAGSSRRTTTSSTFPWGAETDTES